MSPIPRRRDLHIQGVPAGVSEEEGTLFEARVLKAVSELMDNANLDSVTIRVRSGAPTAVATGPLSAAAKPAAAPATSPSAEDSRSRSDDPTTAERAGQYKGEPPRFTLDQLVVADELMESLLTAVAIIRLEPKIFDDWGLRAIEPFPKSALNFHGPPGTGKTLAAHCVADALRRAILVASYAEIESKYHGDGPKNVKAIFHAAERDGAVLFIDEADSLLSRRLTNVSQGSEQAINSMRSQLLICLEQFKGVVIFATNLVENYDKAFETRVRHIRFTLPDEPARKLIWRAMFPPTFPVADPDGVASELAGAIDDVCGRDIRNAVLDAALSVARAGRETVEYADLAGAILKIKAARIHPADDGEQLSGEEKSRLGMKISQALRMQDSSENPPRDGEKQ